MSTVTNTPTSGQSTMTEQKAELTPLRRVTELAAKLPGTPTELVERIRTIREQAHVLSPAVTAASIPDYVRINTVVEAIDVTFDPKTGRGNDVYFQPSIHKSKKVGSGDNATFEPLEVSLNATAIKRMMAAAGVNVTHSEEIPTGERNYWKWQSRGKIRDFDGSWRELPPGTAEIDLRDGSAQIGEWTAEAWAKREAESEERKRGLPENQKWKAKPQPIGGWTGDRVMSARRFGLRLAEAKSLNALGRNFGLKQVYSIDELRKPFVIFRATFNHDTSDPAIKQMLSAAELGATNLLYPGTALPAAAAATAEETRPAIAGEVLADHTDEPIEDFMPDEPTKPARPTFTVVGVHKQGERYLVTLKETGDVKHPVDLQAAKNAHGAKALGVPVYIERNADNVIVSIDPADSEKL